MLAFRAAAQSLDRRRPATDGLDVAGACAVQDTPPGNADVSLAARLDIHAPVVEEAVARKELVLTWSLRGAPHVFPPDDFAVFTLGARPDDGTLEGLWGQPGYALVAIERAMVAVIGSEVRPKGEVSTAVTASVPPELPRGAHASRCTTRVRASSGPGRCWGGSFSRARRRRRWPRPRRGWAPTPRATSRSSAPNCSSLPPLLRADDVGSLRRVGGDRQVGRQGALAGGRRRPGAGAGGQEGVRARGGPRGPG